MFSQDFDIYSAMCHMVAMFAIMLVAIALKRRYPSGLWSTVAIVVVSGSWLFHMQAHSFMPAAEAAHNLVEHEATRPPLPSFDGLSSLAAADIEKELSGSYVSRLPSAQRCVATEIFSPILWWGTASREDYLAFLDSGFVQWHVTQCKLEFQLAQARDACSSPHSPLGGLAKRYAYAMLPREISGDPRIDSRIEAMNATPRATPAPLVAPGAR